MSEATTTPAKPPSRWSKIGNIVIAVSSFILAAIALLKFFDTSLPGCSSSRASDTIRNLLRDRQITGITLSEQRELAKDPNEVRCAATMQTSDGVRHAMTYRIYKGDDGKAMVAAEWRRQ